MLDGGAAPGVHQDRRACAPGLGHGQREGLPRVRGTRGRRRRPADPTCRPRTPGPRCRHRPGSDRWVDDRAGQDQAERARVSRLVGVEQVDEQVDALVAVDPSEAHHVRVVRPDGGAGRCGVTGGRSHSRGRRLRARAAAASARPPAHDAARARARTRSGRPVRRRRSRTRSKTGSCRAGSSWAAGCSTAGARVRPMARTVG